MENLKECDSCGLANPVKVNRCTGCGHDCFSRMGSGASLAAYQITCTSCGSEFHRDSVDCPSCGERNATLAGVNQRLGGVNVQAGNLILTTGQGVPNREVSEIIGLVFAAGNAAFTLEGTASKSGTAMSKASQNLLGQARDLGADAVIAIQVSIDGSGSSVNRSQTVTLFGTAVKLAPLSGVRD